jgi:hypothetical protein
MKSTANLQEITNIINEGNSPIGVINKHYLIDSDNRPPLGPQDFLSEGIVTPCSATDTCHDFRLRYNIEQHIIQKIKEKRYKRYHWLKSVIL